MFKRFIVNDTDELSTESTKDFIFVNDDTAACFLN